MNDSSRKVDIGAKVVVDSREGEWQVVGQEKRITPWRGQPIEGNGDVVFWCVRIGERAGAAYAFGSDIVHLREATQ